MQSSIRLLSTSSSSHFKWSRAQRWWTVALPASAVGLGLTIYLQSAVKAESDEPEDAKSSPHEHEDSKAFAPSVEALDNEPSAHLIIRILSSIGSTLNIYIIEPLGTTKRFVVLFCLFMPVLLTIPMIWVGSRKKKGPLGRRRRVRKDEEGQRWGAIWWYGFLVKQMERAGPTFIKLAQWAGSRRDLFPEELCMLLGKLHSNGKAHSFAYTKKVIERVFGKPFDEIFEEFPHEPLGIGAVAQVYKAKLNPELLPPAYLTEKRERARSTEVSRQLALTYEDDSAPPAVPTASVAIKVLHPKVHRTINRDIKIMSFFANLINLIPGAEWLSFPEEVDVFASMMFSQLDLRNEAKHLRRFEDNFKKRRAAVSFPRPLFEFSTREILFEEYEDALPLKHFLNLGGAAFDHRIATLGLDAFLNMLLIDNFTHADLHPGNIMIKFYKPTTSSMLHDLFLRILSRFDSDYARGAKKGAPSADDQVDQSVVERLRPLKNDAEAWLDELERLDALGYQPELVLIDAGLTVELTPLNRRNFLDLFGAVAEFDGALAGRLMVERCRSPDLVIDEETFALKMQDLVLSVKSKTFSLGKIRIGDVLSNVLQSVRNHHVKMEPDFVNTVISILLLEGIGRSLDPNMDLFQAALPILRGGLRTADAKTMMTHRPDMKHLGPMLKIWLWMEARSWITALADPTLVNGFTRYGWLSGD
ncbi:ABC1-domain-containing protein [Ceraceosorus guamensis]|uniref:ABC1-domain-containing protein n=1 Tax=Ceraceosorus guamensis TaxID=1522189 RepID=A0A316W6Z0_9BASI|nr:ABC1-domain-containing protein [Ceraceosorus guamensis]PWN45609.1 ABC1-domain-containing protein [Ceraceosorus guamensis]